MDYDKQMLTKALYLNVQKFTYNRAQYLKKNGLEVDAETRRQIWDDYGMTIKEVVAHLRKQFPEGFIHREGAFELTFDGLAEDTKVFVQVPSVDCTIKPLGDNSKALMSFEKGVLKEASQLETIPGLPAHYQTVALNRVLEGRNVFEIRDMFRELGLLPRNNMLDIVIEEYAMRKIERVEFAKAVIQTLLLNGNEEDITRAYIFDYFMGSNFDFDVYKEEKGKGTK